MYSVIIPSIGRVKYLNDLIQSILEQTILPKEIIILLDDNKKCKEDSRFIFQKDKCKINFCNNLNLPQKRNYGALIAKTKYLIFSDDDDIWDRKKGELTIQSLSINQVLCHEYSKFGYSDQRPKFLMGKKRKLIKIKDLLMGSNIFGGGSGIACIREVVLAIPFNKEFDFCEDFDWWIKVILAEIKVEYYPINLVKYRVHKENMTSNFFRIYKFNTKILKKLLYISLVLFFAFLNGYLKSSINFLIKFLKYLLLKFIGKSRRYTQS